MTGAALTADGTAGSDEGGGQKPIAAYFGMANGEVEVRTAETHSVKSRP